VNFHIYFNITITARKVKRVIWKGTKKKQGFP